MMPKWDIIKSVIKIEKCLNGPICQLLEHEQTGGLELWIWKIFEMEKGTVAKTAKRTMKTQVRVKRGKSQKRQRAF